MFPGDRADRPAFGAASIARSIVSIVQASSHRREPPRAQRRGRDVNAFAQDTSARDGIRDVSLELTVSSRTYRLYNASRMVRRLLALVLLLPLVLHAQPRPRKIFISVDMEGITGVVQPAQLGPDGFEYQRARDWMTGEVNAAIAGIRESGPAE